MEQVLASGVVLTPAGPVVGDLVVDGTQIVDVRPSVRVGGDPRWVCPGFIDLQINGAEGIDLTRSPERLAELAAMLPSEGVTAFSPTIITCAPERRAAALASFTREVGPGAAHPLGLHLEGPVLAPSRRGAHPAEHLGQPSTCGSEGWTVDAGVVMVTLAPELPGALELIAELTAAGVVVALGHSDATAEEFQAGLDAGATHVTHLYNAMRPFGHRDPGPIGVVLADHVVTAGLICDGIHVDPVAVRMAWRALGPERLVLVTDAVAARGTADFPDGVRTPSGVLAGSVLTLDAALRHLVAVTGASVPDAVRTVSTTPAEVLGLTDRGVLAAGARADVTVLDDELRVVEVYIGGRRTV